MWQNVSENRAERIWSANSWIKLWNKEFQIDFISMLLGRVNRMEAYNLISVPVGNSEYSDNLGKWYTAIWQ
jgi:hypothetical protein